MILRFGLTDVQSLKSILIIKYSVELERRMLINCRNCCIEILSQPPNLEID